MTTYNLAPIPVWYFLDNEGRPASNGFIYTFRDTARNEYKPVYQDAGGNLPYPDPIRLDGTGKAGPFYWTDDENYYIRVTDSVGNTIKTIEHYNAPGDGGAPITTQLDIKNYIQNGQFRLNFENVEIENTNITIAENWLFIKNNTNATDFISFIKFPLGQTEVESNPTYYLKFQCTAVGIGGETLKNIFATIPDVNLFSNEEVTLSIAARSPSLSNLKVSISQNFGNGAAASPEVLTTMIDTTLTANFTKYHATQTLPSISGKTIDVGTFGDLILVKIHIPLNQTCEIDITNIQIERGNFVAKYEEETINDEWNRNRGSLLPVAAKDNSDRGKFLSVIEDYSGLGDYKTLPFLGWRNTVPPGFGAIWFGVRIPDGFWECDGRSVIRADYPQLYDAIGTDEFSFFGGILWGAPVRTSLFATRSNNVITVNTMNNGNVIDASDVDTGFTIVVTQQGSPTQQEITQITTTSATTVPAGSTFFINTLDEEYVIYIIKDGIGDAPTLPGKTNIKCSINGTDDANTVAEQVLNVIHHIKYFIPDMRGFFPRGWSHGTSFNIVDRPIVSITRDGTVATVTMAPNDISYLHIGMDVTPSGADQTEYNGTFEVLDIISETEFRYIVSGTPATPATGILRLAYTFIPDEDIANRMELDGNGWLGNLGGDRLGTYQNDAITKHRHNFERFPEDLVKTLVVEDLLGYIEPEPPTPPTETIYTSSLGGVESRSKNKYVMYIIKHD